MSRAQDERELRRQGESEMGRLTNELRGKEQQVRNDRQASAVMGR